MKPRYQSHARARLSDVQHARTLAGNYIASLEAERDRLDAALSPTGFAAIAQDLDSGRILALIRGLRSVHAEHAAVTSWLSRVRTLAVGLESVERDARAEIAKAEPDPADDLSNAGVR